jgi:hypothetical protein
MTNRVRVRFLKEHQFRNRKADAGSKCDLPIHVAAKLEMAGVLVVVGPAQDNEATHARQRARH